MKQVKPKFPARMLALAAGLALSVGAFAQSTVKGSVKDASGEPIIGASVLINGTSNGTVTDLDGNFSLSVQPGQTLTISYIGYKKQQVTAQDNMVITMQDDAAQSLNEVVVIGYGVVKKKDLTGSVAALKPDSKNKGVVVNAQDLLVGKVAGVAITSEGGTPGAKSNVRIRGGSSLNASNDPLIVIDNVPIDNNGVKGMANILSVINPQDIESFNVLKDASATAIYGSRGSNGVIIITTKKGHAGDVKVSYNGSVTLGWKKKTIDVLDAAGFRDLIRSKWGEDSDPYRALGTADTDWQDLIYQTSISHQRRSRPGSPLSCERRLHRRAGYPEDLTLPACHGFRHPHPVAPQQPPQHHAQRQGHVRQEPLCRRIGRGRGSQYGPDPEPVWLHLRVSQKILRRQPQPDAEQLPRLLRLAEVGQL